MKRYEILVRTDKHRLRKAERKTSAEQKAEWAGQWKGNWRENHNFSIDCQQMSFDPDKCIWNSKFYSLSSARSSLHSQSDWVSFFFALLSSFICVVSIKYYNGHATNTWNKWAHWSLANLSLSSEQHIRFNLDTLQDSRGCASFFVCRNKRT